MRHAPGVPTALAALIGLLGLCMAGSATAGGSLALIEATPDTDKLALGATWWQMPRSPDVRATHSLLTPAIDWYSHTGWFASTENGVGVNLSHDPDWQVGARLWPQWGRATEDVSATTPAIGPRLQMQVFANHLLGGVLMLQSATSMGGGQHHDGLQSEWGLMSGVPTPGGLIGLGVSATWANGAFRRALDGQNTDGWSDVSWTLDLDQRLDARWHVDAQLLRSRLLGHGLRDSGPPGGSLWPRSALISLWRDW